MQGDKNHDYLAKYQTIQTVDMLNAMDRSAMQMIMYFMQNIKNMLYNFPQQVWIYT